MFVFLSKFLPVFIYPLGFAIILISIALLLEQRKYWQRVFLIIALLILLLGSNRIFAAALVHSLETKIQPAPEIKGASTRFETPLAPVIVLLGGGTETLTPPRSLVEVNGAGDRVLYAVQLYRLSAAPKILVTGGNLDWSTAVQNPAQDMAALLVFLGVPQEDIWLEGNSQNTYENALYSRQFLEEKGVQKIILVTSAQHMPRAAGLFTQQGFEVLPAPTDYNLTEKDWREILRPKGLDILFNLVPAASNLEAATGALKECLGMVVYRLRGWMG